MSRTPAGGSPLLAGAVMSDTGTAGGSPDLADRPGGGELPRTTHPSNERPPHMRVVVESQQQLVRVNGLTCRLWEGFTEGGHPIMLFVPYFTVQSDQDEDEAIEQALVPGLDKVDLKILDDLDT